MEWNFPILSWTCASKWTEWMSINMRQPHLVNHCDNHECNIIFTRLQGRWEKLLTAKAIAINFNRINKYLLFRAVIITAFLHGNYISFLLLSLNLRLEVERKNRGVEVLITSTLRIKMNVCRSSRLLSASDNCNKCANWSKKKKKRV